MWKELIAEIGKFKVYQVDGSYIRKNIDADFTNFGQHFRFSFIKEDEFYIDKEGLPQELPFYLTHLLKEYELMKNGMSYENAIDIADKYEIVERHKSKKYKEAPKNYPEQVKKVKLEKIMSFDDIDVWKVDDELVRDLFYDDFTEGGNGKVYKWMPEKEIWISKSVSENEIPYIITHEFVEMFLMEKGWSYEDAHIVALKYEWKKGTSEL